MRDPSIHGKCLQCAKPLCHGASPISKEKAFNVLYRWAMGDPTFYGNDQQCAKPLSHGAVPKAQKRLAMRFTAGSWGIPLFTENA